MTLDVEAVLFDFDGTLIEPSIDFGLMYDAVLAIVARHGLPAESCRGMHVLEMVARARRELEERERGDGQGFQAEAERAILDIELEAADRVLAYRGAPDMLAGLVRRGYGIGIVTRNARAAVERILERIPMVHDVLLTRDDVSRVKPDPEHLLAALRALGVPGHRALMCGDHTMDVIAGRRVGARTAGVLRPGVPASYFAEVAPDLVLAHVTELLPHLGSRG